MWCGGLGGGRGRAGKYLSILYVHNPGMFPSLHNKYLTSEPSGLCHYFKFLLLYIPSLIIFDIMQLILFRYYLHNVLKSHVVSYVFFWAC